jgi:PAS domain S-box-containing protein
MEKTALQHMLEDQKVKSYLTTIKPGQTLCNEGDFSRDLCILISGRLEVFRGDQKMQEITEPGAVLGRISFVLGTKRTATVRAVDETRILLIPYKEVKDFLKRFPEVAWDIPRSLAEEVNVASHVLSGIKELCDHLPDAFLMTDKQGKILSWNSPAEELYGRDWEGMYQKPAEMLFEDREEFRNFLNEILSNAPLKERVLSIHHPGKGTRYISVSTNVLSGGQHHSQGILFLCRDVTTSIRIEKRLRRIWLWLFPAGLLAVFLAVALFRPALFPWNRQGMNDMTKMELQSLISRDRFLLASSLEPVIRSGDQKKALFLLDTFLRKHQRKNGLYERIVVLDEDKRVFAAGPADGSGGVTMAGTSYGAIPFQPITGSVHCVLTLFRPEPGYPMGRKQIDLAFPLKRDGTQTGWLLFQMNTDLLKKKYGIDEQGLKELRFKDL